MPTTKATSTCTFIAVAMLACLTFGCQTTQSTATGPSALDDALHDVSLEAAQQQADDENRVLLVFGTAEWCGWCTRMKEETWTDPEVRDWIAQRATILYVDTDARSDVREALEMEGIPHTIAFRNGEEIDRLAGFREPEDFLDWLNGLG